MPETPVHPAIDPTVALDGALDGLDGLDLGAMAAADLLVLVTKVEVLRRRVDASMSRVVGEVEASGAYGIDGHRSTKASLKASCRLSGAEASNHVATARMLQSLPQLAALVRKGVVPTGHVQRVARLFRNPRVRDAMSCEASDLWFATWAPKLDHDEFSVACKRFEQLADHDGAEDRATQHHERRRVSILEQFDGSVRIEGVFGAVQGATLLSVLDRFNDRLFDQEWAELRAQFGEDVDASLLPRTPAQRRADSLVALFEAAAVDRVGVISEPLINVLVDSETFEAAMAEASGETVADDPTRARTARSETTTGLPLTRSQIANLAIIGQVRRVVYDSKGVVIDLGRKQRLFTGSAREAAMLSGWPDPTHRCRWSGCDCPPQRLQSDHGKRWADGGRTDQSNVDPYCGVHNRLRETGFDTVMVDGTRTHRRPDGSTTTPPV